MERQGNTEGIEEKPELLSPKFVLKREVSFGGKTTLYAAQEMYNIVQIFVFSELLDTFLKIV